MQFSLSLHLLITVDDEDHPNIPQYLESIADSLYPMRGVKEITLIEFEGKKVDEEL